MYKAKRNSPLDQWLWTTDLLTFCDQLVLSRPAKSSIIQQKNPLLFLHVNSTLKARTARCLLRWTGFRTQHSSKFKTENLLQPYLHACLNMENKRPIKYIYFYADRPLSRLAVYRCLWDLTALCLGCEQALCLGFAWRHSCLICHRRPLMEKNIEATASAIKEVFTNTKTVFPSRGTNNDFTFTPREHRLHSLAESIEAYTK